MSKATIVNVVAGMQVRIGAGTKMCEGVRKFRETVIKSGRLITVDAVTGTIKVDTETGKFYMYGKNAALHFRRSNSARHFVTVGAITNDNKHTLAEKSAKLEAVERKAKAAKAAERATAARKAKAAKLETPTVNAE